MEDRQRRKNNIMIFNVAESASDSHADRLEHDNTAIHELFSLTKSDNIIQLKNNSKITRVGKFIPNSKPRPVKIICNNESECHSIIQELWKLKKDQNLKQVLSQISITRDKTQMQQANFKAAKIDMLDRMKRGEKNLYIREVNGFYKPYAKHVNDNTEATGMGL